VPLADTALPMLGGVAGLFFLTVGAIGLRRRRK
jgi:hypothetical protein